MILPTFPSPNKPSVGQTFESVFSGTSSPLSSPTNSIITTTPVSANHIYTFTTDVHNCLMARPYSYGDRHA